MSPHPISKSFFTVLIAAATGLAGCATAAPVSTPANPWLASTTPAADAAPPPRSTSPFASAHRAALPGSVRAVRFTLTVPPGDSDEARAALDLGRALMAEGFQLTDGPGDAQIDIRVAARPSDAPEELVLAVVVAHHGANVESLVGRIATADAVQAAVDVRDLAGRLTSSAQLASFGSYLEQLHFAVAKPSPAARPSEVQVDPAVEEAQAWKPAAFRRCRNARSETACGWIREYLDRFPSGAHAAEARALLGLPIPQETPHAVAVK